MVGHAGRLVRRAGDGQRLARRGDVIALERRQAEEERVAIDARTAEAQQQLERREDEHRLADQAFGASQGLLGAARDTAAELTDKAATARADHAGLVERASALASDVIRLQEAARELEERIAARSA